MLLFSCISECTRTEHFEFVYVNEVDLGKLDLGLGGCISNVTNDSIVKISIVICKLLYNDNKAKLLKYISWSTLDER